MTEFYYLLGFILVWYEFIWLAHPVVNAKKSLRFLKLLKEEKDIKEWERHSKEYKNLFLNRGLFGIFMLIWLGLGLITEQNWPFYIALFTIACVINLISRPFKDNLTVYATIHWFSSLIGFTIIFSILFNHYYIHYPVGDYILEYLLSL